SIGRTMEQKNDPSSTAPASVTRRGFLGAAAGTGVALAAEDPGTQRDASSSGERMRQAYRIRVDIARAERDAFHPNETANADETQFPNKIGSYSKGLPHNALGEVD